MKRDLFFVLGIFILLIATGCSKNDDTKYRDIHGEVCGLLPRWHGIEIAVAEKGENLVILTECQTGRALQFEVPKAVGTYHHGENGVRLSCFLNRRDPLECTEMNMEECADSGGGIFKITESTGHKIKGSFDFNVYTSWGGNYLCPIEGTFEIEY